MSAVNLKAIAVLLLALMLSACVSNPNNQQDFYHQSQPEVRLIPAGPLPKGYMPQVARYIERTFGLRVSIEAPVENVAATLDRSRKQLIANQLIQVAKMRYEGKCTAQRCLNIVITHGDMYINDPRRKWDKFAFSMRLYPSYAAISSARLNPHGRINSDRLVLTRPIELLIARTVGFMYYDIPLDQGPDSVMTSSLIYLQDLEKMNPDSVRTDILDKRPARHAATQ